VASLEKFYKLVSLEEGGITDLLAVFRTLERVRKKKIVAGYPILATNDTVLQLAKELMRQAKLPKKVEDDVAHIAIAAVHQMDYLLTWNCAHIANPHWQSKLSEIIAEFGFRVPVLCTPQALMEGV
jgi:hypothetical protein